MKRVLLLVACVSMIAVGCQTTHRAGTQSCRSCGPSGGSRQVARRADKVPQIPCHYRQAGPAGPATAAYAYPYYTTRAPRDFLMDNPPSVGP